MRDHLLGLAAFTDPNEHRDRTAWIMPLGWPTRINDETERMRTASATADAKITDFERGDHKPAMLDATAEWNKAQAAIDAERPKPVVLTEADALADLNGTPRPDNPTIPARQPKTDTLPEGVWRKDAPPLEGGQLIVRLTGNGHICGGSYSRAIVLDRMQDDPGVYEWLDQSAASPKAPTADAEGWIAHDGGPCPLDFGHRVSVRMRNGTVRKNQCAHDGLFKNNGEPGYDVLANRVIG